MSRFTSLFHFESLYKDQSQLLTDEGYAEFMKRLSGDEGFRVANEKGIAQVDYLALVQSLGNPQHIIFHGWVYQNLILRTFLEGGKMEHSFVDKNMHLKHQWGTAFKAFLSPFVVDRLLCENSDKFEDLAVMFSYAELILIDDRAVVEEQLFKPVKSKLNIIKDAEVLEKEQMLIDFISPLCSDEIISIVNSLSKASYRFKLEYVDGILSAIHSKACTVRFANWILKKMGEVNLNDEHKHRLVDFQKELATGELEVQNHGEGRTPIRWKTILSLLIILLVVGGIVYVIVEKPYNEVEDVESTAHLSKQKLSKADRERLEDLIEEMDYGSDDDYSELGRNKDYLTETTSNGTVLQYSGQFQNKLMKQIINDISLDSDLKEYFIQEACEGSAPFKRYPGVKNLSKKKGSVLAEFNNNSGYDVIVYVTPESSSGEVYSMFLKQGKIAYFKMNKGDILTPVVGLKFNSFKAPHGADINERPTRKFNHHFCKTDVNYYESSHSSLQLKQTGSGKAKFIVEGKYNSHFSIEDVYSLTESF